MKTPTARSYPFSSTPSRAGWIAVLAAALTTIALAGDSTPESLLNTTPESATPSLQSVPPTEGALSDRLDVGVRVLGFHLRKSQQGEPFMGSFIGSINKLDEVQEYFTPYRLFVRFAITPHVGIGLQGDELEIKTLTTMPREIRVDDRNSDGNVVMHALMPFVFFRYPVNEVLEPYVEAGYAFYDNDFEPDARWYDNGRRNFFLDNSTGPFVACGMGYSIHRHCVMDLYLRYVNVDVDGIYHHLQIPEDASFNFPMDHFAYGFSFAYRF